MEYERCQHISLEDELDICEQKAPAPAPLEPKVIVSLLEFARHITLETELSHIYSMLCDIFSLEECTFNTCWQKMLPSVQVLVPDPNRITEDLFILILDCILSNAAKSHYFSGYQITLMLQTYVRRFFPFRSLTCPLLFLCSQLPFHHSYRTHTLVTVFRRILNSLETGINWSGVFETFRGAR